MGASSGTRIGRMLRCGLLVTAGVSSSPSLGCSVLEGLPPPELPPRVLAPSRFARPPYRSGTTLEASYRVLERSPSCLAPEPAPILFVHGLGDESQSFAPFARAVAPCRRRLLVDLPGMGESPALADAGDVTADAVLEALRAIAEREAPGGQVALVGHSMGGTLAMRFAAEEPERVSALVVMSAPAGPFELGDDQQLLRDEWHVLMPLLRLWGPYSVVRQGLVSMLGPQARPDALGVSLLVRQAAQSKRVAAVEGYLRSVLGPDEMATLERKLGRVRAPTLFVYGEQDGWQPPEAAQLAQARSVQTVWLPGVGHFPHLDAPEDLARIVDEFLARYSEPSRAQPPRREHAGEGLRACAPVYGPERELFPVVGLGVLGAPGATDFNLLAGLAHGSVDPSYPLEAGRLVLLGGAGLWRVGEPEPRLRYLRVTSRLELVWKWAGGLGLEATLLAGEGAVGGYGSLGYVPSIVPWLRGYVGYGLLPGLAPGTVLGLELNASPSSAMY